MKRLFPIILLLLVAQYTSHAQHVTFSTNLVDWANLGTVNLETDITLARHLSLNAGAKYNDWEFKHTDPEYVTKNNQLAYYGGFKFWPWLVYSGLWVSLDGLYREFSQTGVWRPKLEEGKEAGGVLSVGYSWMINKHMNFDISAGFKAAYRTEYNLYCCPEHMTVLKSGPGMAYGLNDVSLSIIVVL